VSGCSDRIRYAAERDEEGVALGVHLDAFVRGERLPEQSPMLMERIRVRVPSSCRSLVDPSTSVKRKVTTPAGSVDDT